jgi:mersacidin/lichenicidin family type 2 lantibiotic
MSPQQIVRAWKDADYRAELTSDATASVPASPVGDIDLADSQLDLAGGEDIRTEYMETLGCCQGFTQAGKCDFTSGGGALFCTALCFTFWMTSHQVCPAT